MKSTETMPKKVKSNTLKDVKISQFKGSKGKESKNAKNLAENMMIRWITKSWKAIMSALMLIILILSVRKGRWVR